MTLNKKTIIAIAMIVLMTLPILALPARGQTELPQKSDVIIDSDLGITITSDSPVEDFTFDQGLKQISFSVSGTGSGIAIVDLEPLPMADLIGGPLSAMADAQRRASKEIAVFIDNFPVRLGAGYSQSYNDTNFLFQIPFTFTETDKVHIIKIVAVEDTPIDSLLGLFIIVVIVIVLLSTVLWIKRKRFNYIQKKVIPAL